jgi:non-specific serine/threonine protein kinase
MIRRSDQSSPNGMRAHSVVGKQNSADLGNLPIELTSFVGRRREIARVREHLAASRLVTLVGAGGVGKSRLAVRAAYASRRAFSDGVWFVGLGQVGDPDLVPDVVASALGIQGRSLRAPIDQLIDHLLDQHVLLVFDNCEHLLDAVASLSESLLRVCKHIKILTTSRESVAVGAEAIMHVPPLSTPSQLQISGNNALSAYESTQLFVERANAVVPDLRIDDEGSESIVRICQRLEGLPLAIELAAVRMRAMSAQQILSRLTDMFELLTISNRGVPYRQQTLRLSVDWSFYLCTGEEQDLWSRLSVFSGGFELEAVEAVCGDRFDTAGLLNVISQLVNKSILIRDDIESVMRYRQLETMRNYGREKLLESGEYDHARLLHRQWYQTFAHRAEIEWVGPRQLKWTTRLWREQANLRVVLVDCVTRGEYNEGLRLALDLYPFWLNSGQISEGRGWFEKLIAGSQMCTQRTVALYLSSILVGLQGDVSIEENMINQAKSDSGGKENGSLRAVASYARAWMLLFQNEPHLARASFEDSIEVSRSDREYPFLHIANWFGVSMASVLTGDAEHALWCRTEMLSAGAGDSDSMHSGRFAWSAGLAFRQLQDLSNAKSVLKEGLGSSRLANDALGAARSMQALAWIAQDEHEYSRAATLIGATETLWHDLGGPTVAFPSLRDQQNECERRTSSFLGARKYDEKLRRGRAFNFGEAIEFAIGDGSSDARRSLVKGAAELSGLTSRESEVARLIAEGLTNSGIASQLVISPRTAQGHVEHILAKLGFTSRTQIAAWVVEQSTGLA